MKKTLLLFTVIACNLISFSQSPSLSISQPTCALPFGTVEVTSPLNNAGPIASNLYISEVTDANSGALSYVEIYNGTGVAVNLSNYKLKIFSNGFSTPTCDLALTGSLGASNVFVVAIGSTTNLGGVIPNQTFAACGGFNTNDAVMLTTSSDIAIDLWGSTTGVVFTPLSQPGYTYRRHINAPAPSLIWNPSDWDALDPEDYSNIGSYSTAVNYLYSLDGGAFQASPIFNQLNVGNHVIVAQNLSIGGYTQTSFDIVAAVPTTAVTDFTYTSPVCQTNTILMPMMIPGFTSGGIFSCPTLPALNPTNGSINLAQVPPTDHVISYTVYTDNALCINGGVTTFTLTIQPVSLPPDGPIDQTPTMANPTLSNLVVFPTNVTWYGSLSDALNTTNPLFIFTPIVDGATYFAVNNTNGCPSNPLPITVHVNLSTSTSSDFSFKIVPNPANAIINIQIPNNLNIEKIIIRDISGKTVITQTSTTNNQVSIEHLAGGMYLIEGFSGNQKFQSKFIKQ